ncbi:hypothetical protein NM962_19650 [Mycobacterium sp. SVM_VP21]|nr:hypothetical protein NM962_19650 [Mycobacterium sp. SVM_VP21]
MAVQGYFADVSRTSAVLPSHAAEGAFYHRKLHKCLDRAANDERHRPRARATIDHKNLGARKSILDEIGNFGG